ncbi:MAG TPA: tripartite tricarboxylate transporter substrate-binding protein [Casimicrobiaceae bacterium]|jgi:tripartite-type tricarboxylate transporter receptor subunit TctC|nr:tripartite tricarboxylate transporter substrate-binding protein [Casimicrobiaceae bacterium]
MGLLSCRKSAKLATRCALTIGALAAAVASAPSLAQNYPTQPIKFIVPFTAGGGTDVTARLVAEQLVPKLGQPIVVENRAGASAAIGAGVVAHSPPNGYTLLVGTATLVTNALVSGPSENFDVVKDFEFIGKIGQIDLIVMVNSKSDIKDLQGLVNMMRTQPGKVSFGSPGIGSPAQLGGELLKQLTKSDALHVPYKGESAALNDLLGGQTTFQLCSPNVCVPRIQDGSLRGLAVAAKKRSKMAPSIPTTAEAGVPGFEAGTWYYLAAPKGTPQAIVKKLNTSLNEVFADEKFRVRLLDLGVEVEPGTSPEGVKAAIQAEMDKWRPVVKAAGIKN